MSRKNLDFSDNWGPHGEQTGRTPRNHSASDAIDRFRVARILAAPMSETTLSEPVAMTDSPRLSQRARRAGEPPISFLMQQAVTRPELISLAAGLVDQASLPVDETREALAKLLGEPAAARRALQYGTTQGGRQLRELAVEHLERLEGRPAHEMGLSADKVIVTTGSQQMLELIADVLLDPGDIVLVGAPDYFVFMGNIECAGATAVGVAMDEHGLVPDALVDVLDSLNRAGSLGRVKMLYCTSYYQNPTGVTLAADRRPVILDIIHRWSTAGRIFILEDAAYRELAYGEPAPPSIRSYDERGETVILSQSFSKSFSPGMKTGYTVLPDELLAPVLRIKGNHDFGSSNFVQHLLSTVMVSGRYTEHVEKLRGVYRAKLEATLAAVEAEFNRHNVAAQWTRPHGGLYVWIALPESVDTTLGGPLFHRCVENGVIYVPGEFCFPRGWDGSTSGPLGGPRHTMRLCFGVPAIEKLREGVARLAAAVEATLGD
jgi:2-aminoadipate transaminase